MGIQHDIHCQQHQSSVLNKTKKSSYAYINISKHTEMTIVLEEYKKLEFYQQIMTTSWSNGTFSMVHRRKTLRLQGTDEAKLQSSQGNHSEEIRLKLHRITKTFKTCAYSFKTAIPYFQGNTL